MTVCCAFGPFFLQERLRATQARVRQLLACNAMQEHHNLWWQKAMKNANCKACDTGSQRPSSERNIKKCNATKMQGKRRRSEMQD